MIINTVVMFCGLIVCCLFVFAMYGVYTSLREIYEYFTGRRAKRGYEEGTERRELELDRRKNTAFDIPPSYSVGPPKKTGDVFYCKSCNNNKLHVVQEEWDTYVICPKCNLYALIHSG